LKLIKVTRLPIYLLGKCHIQLKDKSKAREVFEKGIEIASSKGDLMPANEMQSLLSGL